MSLKLLDSNKTIEALMMEALSEDINKVIKKNVGQFQRAMKLKIPQWIKEQPEMVSLSEFGVPYSLASQFGLRPGDDTDAYNHIVEVISDSIQVKVNPINSKLQGGVEFSISPLFGGGGLLGSSAGTVVTEKGEVLDWLNWLLTIGDSTVITGYHYTPSERGRSGGGTMSGGSVWRIPPQFSGTPEDNFVTRAFENREVEIDGLLEELLD